MNIEILGVTFSENTASKEGGAMSLLCSISNTKKCSFYVESNTFEDNFALISGGALFFNLYAPLGENTFTNNIAEYGRDLASYPFKLRLINNDTLKNLVSG